MAQSEISFANLNKVRIKCPEWLEKQLDLCPSVIELGNKVTSAKPENSLIQQESFLAIILILFAAISPDLNISSERAE